MQKEAYVFGEPIIEVVSLSQLGTFISNLTCKARCDALNLDFSPVILGVITGEYEATVVWCNRFEVE